MAEEAPGGQGWQGHTSPPSLAPSRTRCPEEGDSSLSLLQSHANASKTFSFLGTGAQPPVVSKKREGATLNLAAALGLLHWPLPASIDSCLPLYGYHGGLGPGRSPLNPGFWEGRKTPKRGRGKVLR